MSDGIKSIPGDEYFSRLVNGGMSAEDAFFVVVMIFADTNEDEIDHLHMRDVRNVTLAYAKFMGKEHLLSILGKDE